MVASETFCVDTFLNDVKGFDWKTAPSSENQAESLSTIPSRSTHVVANLNSKTKLNTKRLAETELKRMVARGWG